MKLNTNLVYSQFFLDHTATEDIVDSDKFAMRFPFENSTYIHNIVLTSIQTCSNLGSVTFPCPEIDPHFTFYDSIDY